jgi:hypothetical protein
LCVRQAYPNILHHRNCQVCDATTGSSAGSLKITLQNKTNPLHVAKCALVELLSPKLGENSNCVSKSSSYFLRLACPCSLHFATVFASHWASFHDNTRAVPGSPSFRLKPPPITVLKMGAKSHMTAAFTDTPSSCQGFPWLLWTRSQSGPITKILTLLSSLHLESSSATATQ